MAKNKQSNLIACLKMIIIGFIKKYIVYSGIGEEEKGWLLSIRQKANHFCPISFQYPASQLSFSKKFIPNILLQVSFIEL